MHDAYRLSKLSVFLQVMKLSLHCDIESSIRSPTDHIWICRPMLISLQDSTGDMVVLVTYTVIPKVSRSDLQH